MKSSSLITLDNLVRKLEHKISGRRGVLPGEIDFNIFEYNRPESWGLYRTYRKQFNDINLFDFTEDERVLITRLLKKDKASVYQANRNLYYHQVDALGNRVNSKDAYALNLEQRDLFQRERNLIEKVEGFMPFFERASILADNVKRGAKKVVAKLQKKDLSQITFTKRKSTAELTGDEAFILYCVAKKYYCDEARCIMDKLEIKYPQKSWDIFNVDLTEYAARMKLLEDTDDLKVSHEALRRLVLSEEDEQGLH